ncbi:malate--CoA ligase subunit beta [Gammaproteobacteria bacterium]|nr:malate--CoA ligase subunit beta [Gammaproteobacteria bacterium]
MDLHEYQAKELLANYRIPIPRGSIAYSPEQASYRAAELGGDCWVVKAQIHSGARGKAGGVRVCSSDDAVREAARDLLGSILVTEQSGPRGKLVQRLYIEEGVQIDREIYLGFVLDRQSQRVMIVASTEGGMEIEELSETRPESLIRLAIDPATKMQEFQARKLAFALGLGDQVRIVSEMLLGCYRAFTENDLEMLEINPLVLTQDGHLLALDAKLSVDDNALFRHSKLSELRDKSQEDPRESYAEDRGLNYVGLDGDVGCIINGAGLAMATMDMIKLAGGEPANFLDIGGGASPDRVRMAFQSVLKDPSVKSILINIFAGINRCDWIAEGIIQAFSKLDIPVPVIVRLAGTNVEQGRKILATSGLPLIVATSLADGAERAVEAASTSESNS